jgi:hypothetical protein
MAFSMKYYGKFSIAETESLMPFEREIYFDLLTAKMEEEAERLEKARGGH